MATASAYIASAADTGTYWSNTASAQGSPDSVPATVSLQAGNNDVLRCTMGASAFGIGAGCTILGVTVTIRCDASNNFGTVSFAKVQLVKGGVSLGTNQASGAPPLSFADVTFGGAANLWGATLAPADVNDSTFGVDISFTGPSASNQANIDSVLVTITYADPSDKLPGGSYFALAANAVNGGTAWTSPTSAELAPDGVYASIPFSAAIHTDNLRLSNWQGTAVPVGATINGIAVEISWHTDNDAGILGSVDLYNNSGVLGTGFGFGESGPGTAWPVGSSNGWSDLMGGSTDLWGAALTPTIVNGSDFGILILPQQILGNSSGSGTLSIDSAKMQIYYTPAGAVGPWPWFFDELSGGTQTQGMNL